MFFDIMAFLLAGIVAGTFAGLVPAVHPNMIILYMPLVAGLGIGVPSLLAFIVAMAVANSIVSFLPSILLGVPDPGSELSILPGHEMVMRGMGYQAIKLTVAGGLGAAVLCTALLPLIAYMIPSIYGYISPYVYAILISIAAAMILSEEKKAAALSVFAIAGIIGMLSQRLPVDGTLVLFPVFSGFFGASMLLLNTRKDVKIPPQTEKEAFVSGRLINRAVVSGSAGGVMAGMLPGIGSSEIASLFSADKNKHSFLVGMGAITMSNLMLSIFALWLIGKSRSGVSVAVEYITDIGFNEAALVDLFSLISAGIASVIAFATAKKFLPLISLSGCRAANLLVLLGIVLLTLIFTGFYGILLLAICTSLGIATNLAAVKRGLLMAVLILPTILFYLPF